MQNDDLIRLHHMLDAARDIREFAKGRSRRDLDTDRQLVLALFKDVEFIGEVAYQVPKRHESSCPKVLRDIVGMRHLFLHWESGRGRHCASRLKGRKLIKL